MKTSKPSIRLRAYFLAAMFSLSFASAMTSKAEDLAKLAPQDALFFLSRAGNDQIAKVAAETEWGKLLAEPEVARFCEVLSKSVEQAILKLGVSGEQDLEIRKLLLNVLTSAGEFPSALILQQALVGPAGPMIDAAIVINMGGAAEELVGRFGEVKLADGSERKISKIKDHSFQVLEGPPNKIYLGHADGHFIVSIGRRCAQEIVERLAAENPKSLTTHPAIVSGRRHFGGSDNSRVMSGFLNVAKIRATMDALLPMLAMSDPDLPNVVQGLFGVVGVDKLEAIVWESQYRDGGCVGAWFFQSPEREPSPSAQPLTDDDLRWIPQDASWAMAMKFDLAQTYRDLLGVVRKWKSMAKTIEKGIDSVEELIGFRIDEDFLSLFGDSIIFYDSFDSGGLLFSGTVIVLPAKDGEQLRERLRKLVSLIEKPKPATESIFKNIDFRVGRLEHRGHLIEYFNAQGMPMIVTPAWTVCEDRFIVGAYPQMVVATIDRLADKKLEQTSILAHPDVKRAREIIGQPDTGFTFVDSRSGLRLTYSLMLPAASAAASMAQGQGIDLDPSVLPSLPSILRHVFADVRCTRNVEDGVVTLSYGSWPLPGSPAVSVNAATVATAVSVLLPSLSRARELSKRTVCAANMRGMGQGLYIHAMDHDSRFPKKLGELIEANLLTPRQFTCPSTTAVPHEHPTEKQLTECYVYIPGQTTESNPTNVVIYERFDNHQKEGVNVLFQDGHVEFIKDIERVKKLIKETKERIGVKKKKTKKKKL